MDIGTKLPAKYFQRTYDPASTENGIGHVVHSNVVAKTHCRCVNISALELSKLKWTVVEGNVHSVKEMEKLATWPTFEYVFIDIVYFQLRLFAS